jgi:hypothetical protein
VVGITADGARSLRINATIFGDDSVGAPCNSGYAVNLGSTAAVSDLNLDLICNNTAFIDNNTGTAIKVSNCTQSVITLNASRGTLGTGNAHRIKNAVEYGAGAGTNLFVNLAYDAAITPYVGTVVGNLIVGTFGPGQSWSGAVTRTSGVTYTNTTGKPIWFYINVTSATTSPVTTLAVNGGTPMYCYMPYCGGSAAVTAAGWVMVPPWATYVFTDVNVSSRTTYQFS